MTIWLFGKLFQAIKSLYSIISRPKPTYSSLTPEQRLVVIHLWQVNYK